MTPDDWCYAAAVAEAYMCQYSEDDQRCRWQWCREGQRARRIRYMAGLHESMLRHPSRRGRV